MTYEWDVLNRAKVIAGVSAGGTYHYRADGQRVEKVTGTTITWVPDAPLSRSGHYDTNYVTNGPSSRYFYDGQMGFEDDYNPSGSVTKVNRYALGARGIDRIERYADSATTYGYPIYDGHGNIRTTLAKSGSSYTTGTYKTYDVWGSVRSGGDSSDPKQKYCGSLGHVADDESGLTYMRARYYEPSTGRFMSEDPGLDGGNWFAYAANNPVTGLDRSGRETFSEYFTDTFLNIAAAATITAIALAIMGPKYIRACFLACATAIVSYAIYFGGNAPNEGIEILIEAVLGAPLMKLLINWTADVMTGLRVASRSLAFTAVAATFGYALACWGALAAMNAVDDWSKG